MTTAASPRVLVVDDHELFRTGLRALLEEVGMEVEDASGGEAALSTLRRFTPDVVVMDMNMPGMSGIDATARVRELYPRVSVLMLTISRDQTRIMEAVRAGASGYLLKDADFDQIVSAIRGAASGESVLGPTAAAAVMAHVRGSPGAVPTEAASADLTEREREVLVLLASGCDNAVIGARLYMSSSTVKHHVSRILHKLGVDNRLQAAAFAIRNGLADPPPGPG